MVNFFIKLMLKSISNLPLHKYQARLDRQELPGHAIVQLSRTAVRKALNVQPNHPAIISVSMIPMTGVMMHNSGYYPVYKFDNATNNIILVAGKRNSPKMAEEVEREV